MLAKPRSKRLLSASVFAIASLASAGAFAADALPIGNLDGRATGGVSSAATAVPGAIYSGAVVGGSQGVIKDSHAVGRDSVARSGTLLRDAHQASIFLGGALTNRLELSLGLHGTYEHVLASDRQGLYSDTAAGAADGDRKVHQTAFSGASLFAKFKILDAQGFKLALAPFVETGAGESATYSLTRSVGPKAGFMAITSYGARGVGAIDLDIGYRYRDAEQLAGVTLRNELFYKILVSAELTRDVSFFAGAEGRKLKVAANASADADVGQDAYRAREAALAKAGAKLTMNDVSFSLYYGQRLQDAKGFGYGERMAGLQIGMELGNARGARPKHSIATAIEADTSAQSKDDATPASTILTDSAPNYDEYPEMIGAEIDPLDALKGQDVKGDDFAAVEKTLDDNKKNKGLSEDEKIENELAEVRAAKAKAEAEQAKVEAAERAASSKEARARAKDEEKMMQEYMNDAKKDLDHSYEGIGADEIEWNGLNK